MPSARWLEAQLVACMLLLAACRAPEPQTSPSRRHRFLPAAQTPCRDPLPGRGVELLDAGSPPYRTLRVAPARGLRMTIPLDTHSSMSMVQEGAAEGGTACYHLSVSVSATEGPSPWPTEGGLAITPLGELYTRRWDRSMVGTILENNLDDALSEMAPRLPREPVGVGARWRLESHRRRGHATGQEVFTYRLVEMVGTRIALQVSHTLYRPRQFIPTPGGDPDDGRVVEEGLFIDDYMLRLDLEQHPLPRQTPVPLTLLELLRRRSIVRAPEQ